MSANETVMPIMPIFILLFTKQCYAQLVPVRGEPTQHVSSLRAGLHCTFIDSNAK